MNKLNSNYLVLVPFLLCSLISFEIFREDFYFDAFVLYAVSLVIIGGTIFLHIKRIKSDWLYVWNVFSIFLGIMVIDFLLFKGEIYIRFFSEEPRGTTDIIFGEMLFRGLIPFFVFYMAMLRKNENFSRKKIAIVMSVIIANVFCFLIHVLPFYFMAPVLSQFLENANTTFKVIIILSTLLSCGIMISVLIKKWEKIIPLIIVSFTILFVSVNIPFWIIGEQVEPHMLSSFETVISMLKLYLKYLWLLSGSAFMVIAVIIKSWKCQKTKTV